MQQLQKIASAKPDAMILREKQLSEPAYQTLAEQVQRICQEQGVQLICNHQISVAERLSLPVQISVSQLEQVSALSVPFGVSVHKLEEAKQAEQAGASWVIAGHVFATACKPDLPPRGLSFLQESNGQFLFRSMELAAFMCRTLHRCRQLVRMAFV